MWNTGDGERVLRNEEWEVFSTGLDLLRDMVEMDIHGDDDNAVAGVQVFDDLTAEQKLVVLADVAEALRSPSIPAPNFTATNEAAIAAVFSMFKAMLEAEIDTAQSEMGKPSTALRLLLLTAIGQVEEQEEPLPSEVNLDTDEWDILLEVLKGRVLWDTDFAMGDAFLDLPPDEAKAKMDRYGIDSDYFLSTPPEPDKAALADARKRLARLQGLREQ
jgi:hypothetical protein